jgi:hypothetical protein
MSRLKSPGSIFNMRKIYLLAAIFFMIGVTKANAQLRYGINAGLNHSTWKGDAAGSFENLADFTDGYITTNAKNGLYAGGFVEMPLGGIITLQPGVYYSQKGYALKGSIAGNKFDFLGVNAKAEMQSHYIDIPLLIKAEIAKGLQVYAGPQLSYLVKNNLKMNAGLLGISLLNTNMDVTNNFNRADFAITGGASYTFDNGFSVNAGYDHGLSRLDKNSNFKSYNRTFKVGVGFRF